MRFKTRYKFTPIAPKTFTEKSKVDVLTFIPLEERIMRFLQDGTQIHADDEQFEYDADETPYQTESERLAADIADSQMNLDPTNSYPLEKMEMADLYNSRAAKVKETLDNAREAGSEIAKNKRKEILNEQKETKKMQAFSEALKPKITPKE